jgi:AmiR/NasT family two-component response regulator
MEGRTIEHAQALVAAQAGCSLSQALELMAAAARAGEHSIGCVAEQVLDGRMRFSPAALRSPATAREKVPA